MSHLLLPSAVRSAFVLGCFFALGCGSFDRYPTGSRGLGESCEEHTDCEGAYLCSSSGRCYSVGSSGGSCGTAGDACNANCCSGYSCVDWSYEPTSCAATCTRSSQCNSGCCVKMTSGSGACNTPGPNSTCL